MCVPTWLRVCAYLVGAFALFPGSDMKLYYETNFSHLQAQTGRIPLNSLSSSQSEMHRILEIESLSVANFLHVAAKLAAACHIAPTSAEKLGLNARVTVVAVVPCPPLLIYRSPMAFHSNIPLAC